jgi:hypothetical protein
MKPEEWIFIDNKSLDGYMEGFPQSGSAEDENRYADQWITRLYKEGAFKLFDGTEYEVEGESLKIKEAGENSEPIISREFGRPR